MSGTTKPDSKPEADLEDRVVNCADSVLHTYKGHFVAADTYSGRGTILDFTTMVSAGLLTVALIWNQAPVIIPIAMAIGTAVASAYKTVVKPHQTASRHYRAGEAYLRLLDDFKDYIALELNGAADYDEVERRYRELAERRKDLNEDMPPLKQKWYESLDDSIYDEIETTEEAKRRLLNR